MKTIIAAVLLALIATPALAAKSRDSFRSSDSSGKSPKAYIGVSGGKNTIAADTTTTWTASTAASLFAGYSFNDHVGVEAAYTSLGTADTDPVSVVQAKGSLASLSAIGYLPLGKVFSLFARVGYGQSKYELEATVGGTTTTASETYSGAVYGAGAQFNIGQRVGIRLAYDKFKLGSTTPVDSSLVSVGALFKF